MAAKKKTHQVRVNEGGEVQKKYNKLLCGRKNNSTEGGEYKLFTNIYKKFPLHKSPELGRPVCQQCFQINSSALLSLAHGPKNRVYIINFSRK